MASVVWPPASFPSSFCPPSFEAPLLQVKVQAAITADEVAMLAQELGYAVSGSDLLLLDGQNEAGVRVTRVHHPGEYPGRYY